MINILTTEQLITYNEQGLIPGPDESEEEYLKRVDYCLHLSERMDQEIHETVIGIEEMEASKKILISAHPLCQSLYGIAPLWVPVIFSNDKILPWHGGCAWIFQLNEGSPTAALLQLRKKYGVSQGRSFLYSRDEVVAHELAHIGRMMFEEPKFEEVLAFQSSPSRLRRTFGPIVQDSKESGLFILILFLIICLDFFFVAFGYDTIYYQAMWLKLIPIAMIGWGVVRVLKRQSQLKLCLSHLTSILGETASANAFVYRLTDDEIISFSTSSPKKVEEQIREKMGASLRWKLLFSLYFEGRKGR